MCDPHFVANLSVNIAIAVGTIGAVVVALFGKKLRPPKLEVSIPQPVGELAVWKVAPDKQHRAWFYHIRIENKRRWVHGTNPSLNLIGLEQEKADGTFCEEWQGDIQIKWKHPNHYPQPAFIGKPVDYDLMSVDEDKFASLYPIASAAALTKVRKEPFKIKVWLQARCTEADSPVTKFEISWNGKWSDDSKEMAVNFVINPSST